jgi:hypothetical protein
VTLWAQFALAGGIGKISWRLFWANNFPGDKHSVPLSLLLPNWRPSLFLVHSTVHYRKFCILTTHIFIALIASFNSLTVSLSVLHHHRMKRLVFKWHVGQVRSLLDSCTVEGSTTLKSLHPRTNSTTVMEAAVSRRLFKTYATQQGTALPGSWSMCLARQVEILVDTRSTMLFIASKHPKVSTCANILFTHSLVLEVTFP